MIKQNLMANMVEIRITIDDFKEQVKVIKKLWNKILINDLTFHYLLEHGYLLLRCDRDKWAVYEKELKSLNLKYYYIDRWEEGRANKMVSKYSDFFAQYFHILSVLMLNNRPSVDELPKIMERIEHCLFDAADEQNYESAALINIALAKIYYNGVYQGRYEREWEKKRAE
jgi:hypothetical protein